MLAGCELMVLLIAEVKTSRENSARKKCQKLKEISWSRNQNITVKSGLRQIHIQIQFEKLAILRKELHSVLSVSSIRLKDLIKGPVRNNRFQSSHRGPEADLKSLKNRQVIIRCRHRKNAKWNGASFKIRKISYSSSYFKMFRLHNLLFNLELHNFIWKSSMLFY